MLKSYHLFNRRPTKTILDYLTERQIPVYDNYKSAFLKIHGSSQQLIVFYKISHSKSDNDINFYYTDGDQKIGRSRWRDYSSRASSKLLNILKQSSRLSNTELYKNILNMALNERNARINKKPSAPKKSEQPEPAPSFEEIVPSPGLSFEQVRALQDFLAEKPRPSDIPGLFLPYSPSPLSFESDSFSQEDFALQDFLAEKPQSSDIPRLFPPYSPSPLSFEVAPFSLEDLDALGLSPHTSL